jgi:hypothetical protein
MQGCDSKEKTQKEQAYYFCPGIITTHFTKFKKRRDQKILTL